MTMTDRQRDDILKTLSKIVENHEKLINGDENLGIIGLRQRQQQENERNEILIGEIRQLETKIESIHVDMKKEVADKFEILHGVVSSVTKWKDGIQTSVKKYTSWHFWWKIIVFVIVVYTVTTEGAPAAFKWLLDVLKIP